MSKMCPLWPLHIIVMYLLVLCPLWMVTVGAAAKAADLLPLSFDPKDVLLAMSETKSVTFNTTDCDIFNHKLKLSGELTENAKKIVTFDDTKVLLNMGDSVNCWSMFNLTGATLGKVLVSVRSEDGALSSSLPVTVIREARVIDTVFTYSVAILASIIYINFGCALDWAVMKSVLKKPIGPAIGFCCQFVLMPVISFGLGKWIFPGRPDMQLGLFFTGLSPAGGASNIWSVALEANINLSITMTTISTIAAFGMFPFWLFTLGDQIFASADMATPYEKISTYVIALVVPLAFGILSQKYLPRFAKFMVKILKPFSVFLILFIVIFACVANDYLFQLFTWKIAAAGIGLPWLGYFGGFLAALAFKQPMNDVLAIAVETGVQNTGIAVFMLRFALDQPDADLTTVIPVAVSIMTPIPLLCLFIYIRIRNRNSAKMDPSEPVKERILEGAEGEICANGNYIKQNQFRH